MHRAKQFNISRLKLKATERAQQPWQNPWDAAMHNESNELDASTTVASPYESLTLRFHDASVQTTRLVSFTRKSPETSWSFSKSQAKDEDSIPLKVHIVPEDYVPLRYAKTRTRFREYLLRKVHNCHKVLGNLLLFKCLICKNRLIAFHPDHQPSEELIMTKTYPNAVARWDIQPESTRTKVASFHTGDCQRCVDNLAKVEQDAILKHIATFGKENMMDLLWGFPDPDCGGPLTPDESQRLKSLHYCFDNATVVEEMLIALLHMQVSVCYFRPGRNKQYNGLPSFRKNIIAFPQELSEVKQLFNFWTTLSENDIVNVHPLDNSDHKVRQARILSVQNHGFKVEYGDDRTEEYVAMERVQQRVKLPWLPVDLRENLIVLRRRIGNSDQFDEDLRVRRNMLREILLLLTQRGCWRPGHDVETLHIYYDAFDMRTDHEFEELFPEDAVPSQLNFQDLHDEDTLSKVSFNNFQDWLVEGKFNCDIAQGMLHVWMNDFKSSSSDTLRDFYDSLMDEYKEEFLGDDAPSTSLPIDFFCEFRST